METPSPQANARQKASFTGQEFSNSAGLQTHVPVAHYFRLVNARAKMQAASAAYTHAAWGVSHAYACGNREAHELACANRNEASREHTEALDAYDLAVSKSYYAQREFAAALTPKEGA